MANVDDKVHSGPSIPSPHGGAARFRETIAGATMKILVAHTSVRPAFKVIGYSSLGGDAMPAAGHSTDWPGHQRACLWRSAAQ